MSKNFINEETKNSRLLYLAENGLDRNLAEEIMQIEEKAEVLIPVEKIMRDGISRNLAEEILQIEEKAEVLIPVEKIMQAGRKTA